LTDEKSSDTDDQHQRHPDPAQRAMWQGCLSAGKLNDAERERGHGGESVNL